MKQLERILKLRETDANDSEDNDDGVIITIEMQSVIPIFSKLKSVYLVGLASFLGLRLI